MKLQAMALRVRWEWLQRTDLQGHGRDYQWLKTEKLGRSSMITHKYRGPQQFSRVEYSTQIYRFDTRGAKEYLKVLAAELSIQPHLEINYLQQVISSTVV